MRNKLLFTLLLSCAGLVAHGADLAGQMLLINNSSVRSDDDLWQRMRDGFRLDHRETKEVAYWEKRYANQKYFNIIMQNAAPYLYFIISELERRGIPSEIALIPIVESTYNPNAVSPAAISTGMWQFIASSGARFGLLQTADLDERKDIVKSSRAAIIYLQYLHDMFGNWELAIAAYNWGEGNINNAINKSASKNFYDLEVRDVTRQYLPKVLALANIIQNPAKFGLKLTNLANKPYFVITQPATALRLSDFVTMAKMTPVDNKKLNPQYNSLNYLAQVNQRLLLPLSNQPEYLASLAPAPQGYPLAAIAPDSQAIEQATLNNDQAPLSAVAAADAANDALATLAAQADTTTTPTPLPTNSTDATSAVDAILVAAASDSQSQVEANHNPPSTSTTSSSFSSYTVVPGDTLYSIAKKFAVPLESIRSDNQLVDNTVKLNQKLLIRSGQVSS